MRYRIIQRFDGEKWVNYSCHFYLMSLNWVLRQYRSIQSMHPTERFRIAKGTGLASFETF